MYAQDVRANYRADEEAESWGRGGSNKGILIRTRCTRRNWLITISSADGTLNLLLERSTGKLRV
jgi:hypothetical protein